MPACSGALHGFALNGVVVDQLMRLLLLQHLERIGNFRSPSLRAAP